MGMRNPQILRKIPIENRSKTKLSDFCCRSKVQPKQNFTPIMRQKNAAENVVVDSQYVLNYFSYCNKYEVNRKKKKKKGRETCEHRSSSKNQVNLHKYQFQLQRRIEIGRQGKTEKEQATNCGNRSLRDFGCQHASTHYCQRCTYGMTYCRTHRHPDCVFVRCQLLKQPRKLKSKVYFGNTKGLSYHIAYETVRAYLM